MVLLRQGAIPESQMSKKRHGLHRGLSARQVQMIAIAGTIGTGLFLGTGKSLAEGGPASILICYALVGFIVYVTLLLLGEMATQYPVAGSFNAYTTRFFSPSYGFALAWNYWFNDAISVASDLTAAQLVLQFWTVQHTWIVSLAFWVFLVGINAIHVRAYGELGKRSKLLAFCISSHMFHFRVLAIIPQSNHDRNLHYPWHTCQCWRKRITRIHRRSILAHSRRAICWRFRGICSSVCDRFLCLLMSFPLLPVPF